MRVFFPLILLVLFISCSSGNKNRIITPIPFLSDSIGGGTSYRQLYIIEDFNPRYSLDSIAIDQLCNSAKKEPLKKFRITLRYYKSSKMTNIDNIRSSPKTIGRYSNDEDLVTVYSWLSGTDKMSKVDHLRKNSGFLLLDISCDSYQ